MRHLLNTFALAALILLPTAVFASDLPQISFEKYSLPNGLTVVLHEDHSIPVVAVNICYHVGSKNEKHGRTGFAHLFEHLMFEGSQHCANYDTMEAIGGNNNAFTSEDITDYFEVVPSNYLELALWLESDRQGFLVPAMNQQKLDLQRDVVKNERRQRLENQPYAKSEELMLSLLYPDKHPYSWSVIGSMEDLSAASLEDVSGFFKTYYAPNNASMVIAGDFDAAKTKALVEKYFAPIPAGAPIDRMETWIPQLDGVKRAVAEDKVSLPRLFCAWPTPARYTAGDAEFDLLASVLTSGKTSRLYQSLVYEKQIAQDVSAYQSSGEINGTFNIEITAKEGHTLEEIEQAMDAVLESVLKNGVTEAELVKARNAYEAGFVRRLQSAQGRSFVLNDYQIFLGNPGKMQWDLDRYNKVTSADVQKYCKQYLDLNRRAILHIVPQPEFSASEKEFDRSPMPEPTPEPVFNAPIIQRATLSNGLELFLVEKHELPLVQVSLFFKSGWATDPAGRPGIASLAVEMLDEGTLTRNALQISDAVKAIGANFSTSSSYDGSSVYLDVLKKNLDQGLELLTDVALNPTFPKEELERRRQIYLGRIQQESQEPYTVGRKLFSKMLFGTDHPYAQPFTGTGTEFSIKAINREDLVNFYKANFLPNNAALVVVGDLTLSEAKDKFERLFKSWKSGAVTKQDVPTVPALTSTRIYLVDKPGAPQSAVFVGNLGIRRNDADYVACEVMNNTLGGQFTSRLNANLRETKGFTYGARSGFSATRGVGSFLSSAEVQTERTGESVVEIIKELRGISGTRPMTSAELTASKGNLIKGFPQDFQSYSGVAGQLTQLVKFGLPLDEWISYVSKVGTITGEVATRAGKNHIQPDALLIVVVGDRATVESQLKKLNLGEVKVVEAE